MTRLCLFTSTFQLYLLLVPVTLANDHELETTHGRVTGFTKTGGNNQEVEVFYGIPFAQPPIGNLRFCPPVEAHAWEGSIDGTKKPNTCWQALGDSSDRFIDMWAPSTARDEDCLYMNVWRPTGARTEDEGPRVIMVWIFGGGFSGGSTMLDVYDGTELAAQRDVIIVSIGYRLGPFGFLYLGNEDAPGNVGLLDQAMALRWVHNNAENLGGAPDRITIFGTGAGASSIGFHLFSPLTRELFEYAIMEGSSPMYNHWDLQSHSTAKERAVKLAQSINCPSDNDHAVIQCLLDADPETLAINQWDVVDKSKYFDITFGPIVDGHFLPELPQSMMARGDIKRTSVLLGVNNNEGIFYDMYAFTKTFHLNSTEEINEHQFNDILLNIVGGDPNLFVEVKREYSREPSMTYTDILDAVISDTLFRCPVILFAQEYASLEGEVYMYSYEQPIRNFPWPEWVGDPHGYEIQMVFGLPLGSASDYTPEERQLSEEVTTAFTQFAETGEPSDEWPRYTLTTEKYMVMDTRGFRVGHQLRSHQCAFWANGTLPTEPPGGEFLMGIAR